MPIKRLTVGVALALQVGSVGSLMASQRPAPAAQVGPQTNKPVVQAPATPGKPAAATPAKPGDPPKPPQRKQWWSDEPSKKELGLTPDQVKTLDQIFTSTKDELAGYFDAWQREGKELDRLIDESKVERWVVGRQIDKVETQRSSFSKLRTMTLYRMHQVLTPEQRVKLQKMQERDRKDPKKHP